MGTRFEILTHRSLSVGFSFLVDRLAIFMGESVKKVSNMTSIAQGVPCKVAQQHRIAAEAHGYHMLYVLMYLELMVNGY